MIYLNDYAEQTSTLVHLFWVTEIAGISNDEWENLNEDLYDVQFSLCPSF